MSIQRYILQLSGKLIDGCRCWPSFIWLGTVVYYIVSVVFCSVVYVGVCFIVLYLLCCVLLFVF